VTWLELELELLEVLETYLDQQNSVMTALREHESIIIKNLTVAAGIAHDKAKQ